jgi:ER lumen protein retaining receptor
MKSKPNGIAISALACHQQCQCSVFVSLGISVKTHELYLAVFVTRYLDLFTTYYSLYNSIMKVVYIASTGSIIYTILFQEPIKSTYDKSQDSFLHWKFAAAPCAILAFLTHLIGSGIRAFNVMELLWTFSIYLEAIAILPQLIVLQRYREVENLTGNYIFFMGAYRALYILNWIYRANTEKNYRHHWVVYICGVIQTLLYADFFYYYIKRYDEFRAVWLALMLRWTCALDDSVRFVAFRSNPLVCFYLSA